MDSPRSCERIARDSTDPQSRYSTAIALADLAFAHGDHRRSVVAYRQAGSLTAGNAMTCYTQAARAAILVGDAEEAATDLAALEGAGVHGPWIETRISSVQAGLAALGGRPDDSLGLYEGALRAFRDLGLPVDEALTAIEMVNVLDPTLPEVQAAAEAARRILSGLRAAPFLERLDAAVARASTSEVSAAS